MLLSLLLACPSSDPAICGVYVEPPVTPMILPIDWNLFPLPNAPEGGGVVDSRLANAAWHAEWSDGAKVVNYDASGRAIHVVNAWYGEDDAGNPAESYASQSVRWDDEGCPAEVRQSNGNGVDSVTRFRCDEHGQVRQSVAEDGSTVDYTNAYAGSALISSTVGSTEYTLDYDQEGRLAGWGDPLCHRYDWNWDDAGVAEITHSEAFSEADGDWMSVQISAWEWNDAGRATGKSVERSQLNSESGAEMTFFDYAWESVASIPARLLGDDGSAVQYAVTCPG